MKSSTVYVLALAAVLSASGMSGFAHGTATDPAGQSTQGFHKRFKNADHWVKVFDDPARDIWQKPDQVVQALKLQANDRIADIGAGTGYFSVRMAKAIPEGKVFAVDTEADMIKYLQKLAGEKKLANLIPVSGKANNPELPESVNLVLIVDTLHHIDDRAAYLASLKPKLLPQARLAVIDFNESSKVGPPLKHRLSKESVIGEFKNAGYELAETLDFLPNQYFLIFKTSN
ncbi:MAG: methyltransferase domain-containing protein [Cyanobacteria bacterium SZAS LIN-3]|nr:methyltransferase domain-containing protein [Cyanobacteria bacterium SZAS LIN-3]